MRGIGGYAMKVSDGQTTTTFGHVTGTIDDGKLQAMIDGQYPSPHLS